MSMAPLYTRGVRHTQVSWVLVQSPGEREDTVRLYRGMSSTCSLHRVPEYVRCSQGYMAQLVVSGRWFTDSREIAQWYVDDAPDGVMVYVDVPDEVAHSAWLPNQSTLVCGYSRDPEHEFLISRGWSEKARPL